MLGRKRPLNPDGKVTGGVLEQPIQSSNNGHHIGRIHIMSARALRYIIPALSALAVLLQGAVFVGRQDIPAEHAARNGLAHHMSDGSHAARQTTSGSRRRKLSDGTTTSTLPASSTAKTGSNVVEPETSDDEFKKLLELDSNLYNLNTDTLFPKSMNKLVTDMAIVPRKQFARELDVGYALDKKQEGNEQVLLLYANQTSSSSSLQSFSVRDAKERCKVIKVVLTDPDPKKQECIAIMGQWSSYHVHKFKRKRIKKQKTKDVDLLEDADGGEKDEETINDKYEFKYSPARRTILPTADQQEANRRILLLYLSSYPAALEKLKPIAELASRGGSKDGEKMPITVLLSNYGQSRFLINYICAARARNIDVSRVLLFATDKETYKLGEAMGLAVFYDESVFSFFPKEAAKNYHDISYALIMMTKVFSVHLVNALGHDLLFSDVDIALYKDPTEYFFQQSAAYDAFFQHDGYHHPARFAPLAANTGFYYVQNNERTRYFFSVFVRMGDLVIKERSHQAALTTLINEHMSLYGLRVKVMGKDSKKFMSGYHYHADKKLMRKLKEGRHEPHLFHANWLPGNEKMPVLMETKNWFVQEQCLDKSFNELKASFDEIGLDCCLLEPAPYVKESSYGDEKKTQEEFQKVIEGMQQ